MGKRIETQITDFSGGMTNSLRSNNTKLSRVLRQFDILTAFGKMIPFRSQETDTFNANLSGDASTEKLSLFATHGSTSGTTHTTKMYGLGVNQGTDRARIFIRDSLPNGQWSGSTASASGSRSERLFVEYQGSLYGAKAGTTIWEYNIGSTTLTEDGSGKSLSVSYADINQGLVHSKDDILYVPYDNKIAKLNSSTWTAAALTLPQNVIVTSLAEYGNYLAIATKPRYFGDHSIVYLWDRDSSLTTLSEKIDWGTEPLELIEEVDGVLLGVSATAATALSFSTNGKVSFKSWQEGPSARPFLELSSSSSTMSVSGKQKDNNRMYFMMSVELNGTRHDGVWTIGRNPNGNLALSLDRLLNNDTAITSVALKGFYLLGDYMTVSFTNSGTYNLLITNDDTSFSATSVYESLIFNAGDSSLKKDLIGVTITHEPLPAAGQVVVKYKKDEESSFTTILTNSTDNSISDSAVNIESSGASLPKDYKEIQFRIESTGNASITGFSFQEEITDKRPYT